MQSEDSDAPCLERSRKAQTPTFKSYHPFSKTKHKQLNCPLERSREVWTRHPHTIQEAFEEVSTQPVLSGVERLNPTEALPPLLFYEAPKVNFGSSIHSKNQPNNKQLATIPTALVTSCRIIEFKLKI